MNRPSMSAVIVGAAVLGCVGCAGESTTEATDPTWAEELQTVLSNTLSAFDGTGASAAVLIPGEQPWLGAAGISHGSTPITPQMIFGVSSITKSYTAALVLLLAEEGLLSLEDSLHTWLPEVEGFDGAITIRQLLNHTSGVYDFVPDPDFWPSILADPTRVWTPQEVIGSFVKDPYFPPGEGYHYSNTGYLLLGMVVEEVTGSSVSSNLRSRLFGPQNLDRTALDFEETIPGEVAHAWNHLDGDGVLDDLSGISRTASSSATWTAGAVYSTAGEMAQFARALFGGEIIGEYYLDEMLTFPASGYGLGVGNFPPALFGAPAVGHDGSGLGYSGLMVYLPDSEISLSVLMNDNNLDCLSALMSGLVSKVQDLFVL